MTELDYHLMSQLQKIYSEFLLDAGRMIESNRSLSGFLKAIFPGKRPISERSREFAEDLASFAASLTPEDDICGIISYIIDEAESKKGIMSLYLILTAVWQYFVQFVPYLPKGQANIFVHRIEATYPSNLRTPVMESFLAALRENSRDK